MNDEVVTRNPKFIQKKYKKIYKEPYKKVIEFGAEWYKGTGILWGDHPLKNYIPKWASACALCKNETKIIAAHYVLHVDSGNISWDCEVYCENCKRYTQRSYIGKD